MARNQTRPKFKWPKRAKTWQEIFEQLAKFNTNSDTSAGSYFEVFCKHFFLTNRSYSRDYKEVKLLSKVDPRVLKRLNIEKKDHGIDLLLKHVDGRYAALQCKFTNDQSKKNLTWTGSRLSSWLAASTKSDIRILFTNASGVSLAVKNKASEKEYHQFSYSDLASLAQDEVQAILDSIHNRKPQRIVFKPRDHQREAIKSVTSKFKKFDRGKLILPCGSGKTLTSLWIKEKLRPGNGI